jgi:NAD(P)-dependent dehydrogenase (short-subunit alcohol dehydrogenase family)
VSGRLAGKAALITGAARGIGRALAVGFAAEGAVVHVADRGDPGDTLALLPKASRGEPVRLDVAKPDAVRTAFAGLERLDILVNCAGITGWIDVRDPDEATWDAVIDTNLKGTFFCSLEGAKLMRRNGGGSIVNVSTVVAARGFRNLSAYAASKGGINALTLQLATELAPDHIRVNAFAPGATNVERNLADDPDYVRRWAPLIPLGRVAEPEDMVGPAVFLASDDSRFVTAQIIYVDGGWTAVGNFPAGYVDAAARRQGENA